MMLGAQTGMMLLLQIALCKHCFFQAEACLDAKAWVRMLWLLYPQTSLL